MNNIMLDLETLGTKPGSVIISMAAIPFDIDSGNTGMSFSKNIDVSMSIKKGFKVNGDTLKWWLDQNLEIMRDQFTFPHQPQHVLEQFRDYLVDISNNHVAGEPLLIWANSPSFDCALLRTYYEQYNMAVPWQFWNERDVRTIGAIEKIPLLKKDSSKAHDPLYDCEFQIAKVIKAYKQICR